MIFVTCGTTDEQVAAQMVANESESEVRCCGLCGAEPPQQQCACLRYMCHLIVAIAFRWTSAGQASMHRCFFCTR